MAAAHRRRLRCPGGNREHGTSVRAEPARLQARAASTRPPVQPRNALRLPVWAIAAHPRVPPVEGSSGLRRFRAGCFEPCPLQITRIWLHRGHASGSSRFSPNGGYLRAGMRRGLDGWRVSRCGCSCWSACWRGELVDPWWQVELELGEDVALAGGDLGAPPEGAGRAVKVPMAGVAEQVITLLARGPSGQVSLDDSTGVPRLLRILGEVGQRTRSRRWPRGLPCMLTSPPLPPTALQIGGYTFERGQPRSSGA